MLIKYIISGLVVVNIAFLCVAQEGGNDNKVEASTTSQSPSQLNTNEPVSTAFRGQKVSPTALQSKNQNSNDQSVKISSLNETKIMSTKPVEAGLPTGLPSTTANISRAAYGNGIEAISENSTVMRAFYVLMGVTVIIIIYFMVRACRGSRTKKTSSNRKYGLLSTGGGDRMELSRLEEADDDDDQHMLFDRTRDGR